MPKISLDRLTIRPEDRFAYRVDDAAAAVGLSRSKLYKLAEAGQLRMTKVAGRTLILREDLLALLHGKEASLP
jgi:excisionase family DNA binding protein